MFLCGCLRAWGGRACGAEGPDPREAFAVIFHQVFIMRDFACDNVANVCASMKAANRRMKMKASNGCMNLKALGGCMNMESI